MNFQKKYQVIQPFGLLGFVNIVIRSQLVLFTAFLRFFSVMVVFRSEVCLSTHKSCSDRK